MASEDVTTDNLDKHSENRDSVKMKCHTSNKEATILTYPKDTTRYEVLPYQYTIADDGSEPPLPPSRNDPYDQYFHVDSGSTVNTINQLQELHDMHPTNAQCGTTFKNSTGIVTGIGTLHFKTQPASGNTILFSLSSSF